MQGVHTYLHTCIHTYTHTYLHTYLLTYFATYLHTYLHMPCILYKPENSPFHGWFFSFTLQCYPTWMRGNFGLNLQNSPKLPHIHARFHCNSHFTQWQRGLERRWIRRKRKDYLLHRALRREIFLQKSKVMSCNVWTFLSVLKFFIDF